MVVLAVPSSAGQIAAIVLGGVVGWRLLPGELVPLPLRFSQLWSVAAMPSPRWWTSAIHAPADFAIAVIALLLLVSWKAPPWLVVVLGAVAAAVVSLVG